VVLLHGWPVTSIHWRRAVPVICAPGLATVCIDLRGLGASVAADGNFEKENLAREILQVLETLIGREARFAVIGHDWGGSVAVALATLSERVAAVVVEEEIPPGITAPLPEPGASRYPSWHGAFHRQKPLAETLISSHMAEYFRFFQKLRADPKSTDPSDLAAFLQAYSDPARLPILLDYYRTHARDSAFFGQIARRPSALPALAVGGRMAMGTAVGAAVKQLFSKTENAVFEKSGHYPAQEEPELFGQTVSQFLKRVGFKA
jgi:pimeloyl-ACP methyl ester carboxylesterase